VTPATKIERGDVLTLAGARAHVEAVAQQIGYAEWPTDRTDMVTVGLAIVIGGLIGIPALHLGSSSVSSASRQARSSCRACASPAFRSSRARSS
jgi:putative transport protein